MTIGADEALQVPVLTKAHTTPLTAQRISHEPRHGAPAMRARCSTWDLRAYMNRCKTSTEEISSQQSCLGSKGGTSTGPCTSPCPRQQLTSLGFCLGHWPTQCFYRPTPLTVPHDRHHARSASRLPRQARSHSGREGLVVFSGRDLNGVRHDHFPPPKESVLFGFC